MKVCHPWQWVWKCNECLPAKKVKAIKKMKTEEKAWESWSCNQPQTSAVSLMMPGWRRNSCSTSRKPPLVSSVILSNRCTPTAGLVHVWVSRGKARRPCTPRRRSHAGGTAGLPHTWQLHSLRTNNFYRASSRQHRCLGRHSPGHSRGPGDPLTKRVSLPAHRGLLEEWWLG